MRSKVEAVQSKLPNQFPKYAEVDTSDEPLSGQTKTCWFYTLCAIGIIVLAVFYAATLVTAEEVVMSPSYADFLTVILFLSRDFFFRATSARV